MTRLRQFANCLEASEKDTMMGKIETYADVTFPFDTRFANGGLKVRLLGRVVGSHKTTIIGYYYHGDDPTKSFGQVLNWDENGVFSEGLHPEMDIIPPPGAIAGRLSTLTTELTSIRDRLAANPDAPQEWRSVDEVCAEQIEKQLVILSSPHIWENAK